MRGRGIYLISSGFGEIYGSFARRILKRCLSSARFIGARTEIDKALAEAIAPGSEAMLMPDLCFSLPIARYDHAKKYFAIIGTSDSFFASLPIDRIRSELGLTPIIIVLFGKEDAVRSMAFGKEADIECFSPSSADELLSRLSRCAFSISARLHGAIFSLMASAPSLLYDAHLKNRALIDEIKMRADKLGAPSPLFALSGNTDIVSVYKKEIEAQGFDFSSIINSLARDSATMLDMLF